MSNSLHQSTAVQAADADTTKDSLACNKSGVTQDKTERSMGWVACACPGGGLAWPEAVFATKTDAEAYAVSRRPAVIRLYEVPYFSGAALARWDQGQFCGIRPNS